MRTTVKNARKPLNDGGNLWYIPKGHSGSWAFRYSFNKKAHTLGLGTSITHARAKAGEYRELLQTGINPVDIHKQRNVETGIPTFKTVSAEYIDSHKAGWSNQKHVSQWTNSLATYANPVIGNKPVDSITVPDIKGILKPIWYTKTETANHEQ